MSTTPYNIPAITPAEQTLIDTINNTWDKPKALKELKDHLQVAVEIELATIPIYLSTYYSINRTPGSDNKEAVDVFPKSKLSRFADSAGGMIMSVAIEEMLHMSLSANVLYSLGQDPEIYGNAPDSYPAHLPGHRQNELCAANDHPWNNPIPLAKFSFDQLSHFLAIEYPAPVDAPPEPGNWDTIGQIYSYVRCIVLSKWIEDCDFQVRENNEHQIAATEYSPNCIDTVFPQHKFNYVDPLAVPQLGSAAKIAGFASNEDSHFGASQLLTVSSCEDAVEAIATICAQGEGFSHTAYDDPSKAELSHYYKFLTLQSELVDYTRDYISRGSALENNVAPLPIPPKPAVDQYSDTFFAGFVYPAPDNPQASQFTDGRGDLVNIADGLFQYMLIMTETVYKVPTQKQKIFFNRAMHQSMIWILDKLLQVLRTIKTECGCHTLCATFANINLGERDEAFATLNQMVTDFTNKYGNKSWYTATDASGYLKAITELPDISVYWRDPQPVCDPSYLDQPTSEQGSGTGPTPPKPRSRTVDCGSYSGTPKWPLTPPKDSELPEGALRHACMGLNSCKNQGRTAFNHCAGQGYCATALAYNPEDASSPSVSDHLCHVLNDCRNQGGCGLYGTAEELEMPGRNDCQSQGSCATPINAERFITDGDLRGSSVWQQARLVFTAKVWPDLKKCNPDLPDAPQPVPGSVEDPNLFQYGPTIGWIENDNDGQGMTACGASGMSGAGSCA